MSKSASHMHCSCTMCLDLYISLSLRVFAVLLLIPYLLAFIQFMYLLCILVYFLLPLAFPGSPHLSSTSLPPSITACWTGMTAPFTGTMPLQAWMHPTMHVCVHKCVSVCACAYVTHGYCGHRLFLGENTDAAFCFCSCFTLQFVLLMLW